MRFLIDAQLPPGLAQLFKNAGHEAEHVYDIGKQDSPSLAGYCEAIAARRKTDRSCIAPWNFSEKDIANRKNYHILYLTKRKQPFGQNTAPWTTPMNSGPPRCDSPRALKNENNGETYRNRGNSPAPPPEYPRRPHETPSFPRETPENIELPRPAAARKEARVSAAGMKAPAPADRLTRRTLVTFAKFAAVAPIQLVNTISNAVEQQFRGDAWRLAQAREEHKQLVARRLERGAA